MEKALLHAEIEHLYNTIVSEIASFNEWWPQHVRDGAVWKLAVHAKDSEEPFSVDKPFDRFTGPALIEEATAAISQLKMSAHPNQNPVTSMRMPGWIALTQPPTERIERINAARTTLSNYLDRTFDGRDLTSRTVETYRSRALREVIPGVSLRHLFRKVHAFDQSPLCVSFIWSGKGGSSSTITNVASERVRLRRLIAVKAKEQGKAEEELGLNRELELLASYTDEEKMLVVVKPNTPHPRVMLMFDSRSRWDAMPHANLPIFLYCPQSEALPDVRELPAFAERTDNRGSYARNHRKLISDFAKNRKLYEYEPSTASKNPRMAKTIRSTYDE